MVTKEIRLLFNRDRRYITIKVSIFSEILWFDKKNIDLIKNPRRRPKELVYITYVAVGRMTCRKQLQFIVTRDAYLRMYLRSSESVNGM